MHNTREASSSSSASAIEHARPVAHRSTSRFSLIAPPTLRRRRSSAGPPAVLVALLAALSLVAAACGFVGGDEGPTEVPTFIVVPTPTPSPTPSPTPRPVSTPTPVPSPTPIVEDSFVDLTDSVREIFTTDDPAAAIEALVPVPFDFVLPDDAVIERVQLEYHQWAKQADITDDFAPRDSPASVLIEVGFLTETDVIELGNRFRTALLDVGFEVLTTSVLEDRFSDTSYELPPGLIGAGAGGEARFNALRQGDDNFAQFTIDIELETDSQPAIIDWPGLFAAPFQGGFTFYTATGARSSAGDVEVSARTTYTIGVRAPNHLGILEILAEEYPTLSVELTGTLRQATEESVAVTSILHLTGATGSIVVDSNRVSTFIDFRLFSDPD